MRPATSRLVSIPAWTLLLLLLLPVLGLTVGSSPGEVIEALSLPSTRQALWLSVWTTTVALVVMLALGTPLAWWLSRHDNRRTRFALLVVELPVVLPPAVLGVALLETFGRMGLLGPGLSAFGISIPFTAAAVVIAQVLVGTPLYVLTATASFQAVEDDQLLVARTLGASPGRAWATVAFPAAAGGLISGAGLAWARALGEFGATLMFAGNLPGSTQTLTLAIYGALERDVAQARAISLLLVGVAVLLLVTLRLVGTRRAA